MITVFGSINLDLIAGVERLPRPGETVPGGGFETAPGGKGANQALAARRAGAPVRMIGAVGEDDFGGGALTLLREGGVDLAGVRQVAGPTGVALILVDKVGENVIVVVPGANGTVDAGQAEELDFAPGDVLLLQLEVPIPAIAAVARRARHAGARVILNFAPFRSDALSLLEHVTHLVVNETECALISEALGRPSDSIEPQASLLAAHTGAVVVVTLGREGVVAADGERTFKAEALAIDPIDTVGAGDTFCGYLAAALIEDAPLADALRMAAVAGSLACIKPGAQPAIPLRESVERSRRTGVR